MTDRRPIDLHCHSTYSDGTVPPAGLVALAVKAGLAALSLTDHDNCRGWPEVKAAAEGTPLEVLPGIELSTYATLPGGRVRRVDLLAYLFAPSGEEFEGRMAGLRRHRERRNGLMIEKLATLGIEVTWKELHAVAGSDVVGRPHFARVMANKKIVRTPQEAFEKYIGDRGPAFVPKESLTTVEAVALAARAGGVCSLAHPGELHVADRAAWRAILHPLVEAGLAGIEAYYPEHTPADVRLFEDLARDLDLIPTGGSDFHGDNRPGVRLGVGTGNLRVPYESLTRLRARRDAVAPGARPRAERGG